MTEYALATPEWAPKPFDIVVGAGIQVVEGYVWRGLGLDEHASEIWTLTHLNSGHRIAILLGDLERVQPVASKIAAAFDWTFVGLDDYLSTRPSLRDDLRSLLAEQSENFFITASEAQARDVASIIARKRA